MVTTRRRPQARRRNEIEFDDRRGVRLRGAALAFWRAPAHEIVLAGPAETGKTYACLLRLDYLLANYPRAQAVLVRKVRDTIFSTVLQTYLRKVQNFAPGRDVSTLGVKRYGGERPQWFDYPNGARLWLAGIDDPGKALSSERDYIYVNQAEELSEDDWQVLTTRATGRAGNTPRPQIFGDCNPGPPHHWLKHRQSLTLLESRHEDNPVLYDAGRGAWTEQGQRTLAVLDALTGARKQRLRFGRWVSAEGTVYEYDARVHLVDAFPIPREWARFRVYDFGHINPFFCGWFALDHDGRLYLYRQIYMTRRTVKVHAAQVLALSKNELCEADIADHDASDRATLAENGLPTIAALKALRPGIDAVTERLKIQPDGRPRFFVLRGSLVERDELLAAEQKPVCAEDEFAAYEWAKDSAGRPTKDVPVDKFNHALDGVRYAVMYADQRDRVAAPITLPGPGRGTLVPSPFGR
jgi:phage terminase large subunit